MLRRPAEILLVEDNPVDARLIVAALGEGQVTSNVTVASDGEEALALLGRRGRYVDAALPDIILLDLGLPKKDGRQVLAAIKADSQLKRIPVITLTTSEAEQDILAVYDLQGNCFITKPTDPDKFLNIVRAIETFWLSTAQLPSRIQCQ